jgi:hypothetical protein
MISSAVIAVAEADVSRQPPHRVVAKNQRLAEGHTVEKASSQHAQRLEK